MIRRSRLFWKLFLGSTLLLASVCGACVWLALGVFENFYLHELTRHLEAHANLVRHEVGEHFAAESNESLDRFAKTAVTGGIRITLIAPDGAVLGDSESDPADMDSHGNRPEVLQALEQEWGRSTRWSKTVSSDMTYIAVRLGTAAAPVGIVRVSMAVNTITARTRAARLVFWRIGIILTGVATIISLVLARSWTSRIARTAEIARSISKGNLELEVKVQGDDEIGMLARSLNRMRKNLAGQLETINRQKTTLEGLLTQLQEGVVVSNRSGTIVFINRAAADLLGLQMPAKNEPAWTIERIPNSELQEMLLGQKQESEANPLSSERRIYLNRPDRTITLLARSSPIQLSGEGQGDDERTDGRLLMVTDVTELTRTVQVKADFVTNASHELRTPLSAIRAAAETLMSGDLDQKSESSRVLRILNNQALRLEAMVNDLLDLSRLESPSATFEPATVNIDTLLTEIYERAETAIQEKGLNWKAVPPNHPKDILASRYLLRLALDNLVENAIKFTEDGGSVRVTCQPDGNTMRFSVEDTGCGISAEEHDRVFERFYQVERARSGVKRGTGLGLAIVRHAVTAMHGEVDLKSTPGEGTTVTLSIPMKRAPLS